MNQNGFFFFFWFILFLSSSSSITTLCVCVCVWIITGYFIFWMNQSIDDEDFHLRIFLSSSLSNQHRTTKKIRILFNQTCWSWSYNDIFFLLLLKKSCVVNNNHEWCESLMFSVFQRKICRWWWSSSIHPSIQKSSNIFHLILRLIGCVW